MDDLIEKYPFITNKDEQKKIDDKIRKHNYCKGVKLYEHSKICMYEEDNKNNNVKVVEEIKFNYECRSMSFDDLHKAQYDYQSKALYVYCIHCRKEKVHNDLSECYKQFVKDNKNLRTLTNGFLKLNKYGVAPKVGLYLFTSFNIDVMDEFEPVVNPKEYDWLEEATKGGFIWANNKFEGKIKQYDINSFYPSIMQSNMMFMMKEGKFKTIDKLKKKLKYGIYRCYITGDIDYRLFKPNDNHYYTHIDIKRARQLEYDIELIQDDEPNFLYYDDSKGMTGEDLFKDFNTYLYHYKVNKDEPKAYIKAILTSLYGQLTQSNIISRILNINDEYEIDGEVLDCHSVGDNKIKITYVNKENGYKGILPRLKPFLLSKSRYDLSNLIEEDIDNIVRVQTDGFMTTSDYEYELSSEIGCLKIERDCYVKINNVNNIEDENGNNIIGKKK